MIRFVGGAVARPVVLFALPVLMLPLRCLPRDLITVLTAFVVTCIRLLLFVTIVTYVVTLRCLLMVRGACYAFVVPVAVRCCWWSFRC